MKKLSCLFAAGSAFALAHPAYAQDLTTASAVSAAATDDIGTEIVVLGTGQARQVQEIDGADIALEVPGISPLKAIDKLPGVNFQSADPFGSYEWSTSLSIRGFSQSQLGFTLDGIPLGDMSYANHNGLHISRAIISENVGRVEVAQGSGSISAASTSNLGGTLEFFTRSPEEDLGIEVHGTYGSEDYKRAFVRLDTGSTPLGPRLALSYAFSDTDKWKGEGTQRQHQANIRLEQPLDSGRLWGFVNFSDRRENDYQDLSAAMIDRLGYDWDNYAPDWDLAVRVSEVYQNQVARAAYDAGIANGTIAPGTAFVAPYATAGLAFPAPIQTVDDAYYDAAGLRRDWLYGVGVEAEIASGWSVSGTAYHHDNKGAGLWFTPYVVTPGGAPITIRTTEYVIDRTGGLASTAYELGFNRLEVGVWLEDNKFNNARRFYGLADTEGAPSRDSLEFPEDPLLTQWEFDYHTETVQYHVADTIDLDRVQLNLGWKGMQVESRATPVVAGGLAGGEIEARDWFLPQAGALFRLTDDQEIFASYTENMRAFTSSVFSTTQAGFDAIDLEPETSTTYEIGIRTKGRRFQGVLAAYYVDFQDRIISLSSGPGIVGSPSILQNVGSVRSIGVEAAGTFRVTPELALFASYAYNDSEYQDDVIGADGSVVTETDGKTVANSPKHLAKGEITYDSPWGAFGRIGANYTSRRFYSYENDASVDGFVTVDASIGYRFTDGALNGFTIQANATNLFDEEYVSTIGSNGFTNSGDSQTLLAGAPRQFFITVKADF